MKGIILDLYSGMGGASEAFVRDGWEVIRMENNPMLADIPHTRIIDVLDWKNWLDDFLIEIDEQYGRPIDIVWASPPCREFSTGYSAPWPTAMREGRDYTPDLSLMEAAYDIICRIRPQYWIIENVSGAVNWFKPELGEYRQRIGPFCLWGRFPSIHVPPTWRHSKMDGDTWSTDPLRANRRAYVPLEISDGLLQAVSSQSSLFDWC